MYPAKSDKCASMLRELLCLALLGFLITNQNGFAQSSNGQITGLVTDTTGAAVDGASVSATNKATGVAYTSTTNGSGVYVLPQLVPGPYKISLGDSLVSFFNDPKPHKTQPSEVMARLIKAFRQGTSVSSVMREFLALVMPSDHSPAEI